MFIRGKKFLAVLLAIAVVGAPLTAPLAAPAEPTTAELSSLYTFDTNGGSAMYNVNLTANGDIDWFQLSRDSETSYAKKSGGAGLYGFYRNTDAAPGGGGGIAALGYINDGRINYTATDADPTLPAIVNRYGLTVRGVGNYLEFKIAESAQPRFLQVYSGNWSAQARIDYIVGGEVKWSRTFANGAHNAVYCATIYIEPNTEGAVRQTLTDMTSYGSSGGSTFLFAAALGAAPVIDKTNLAMKPGETETITATPGEGVVWSSSAPTVASVDQNGVVTAHRTGEAVITAALDGVQRQCAVTVISATAEVVAGGYVIDMADLPKVHFGDHPEWEEMYDASWQMHKSNIKKISGNGWNPDMPYYVDEAFSGYIYAWDTLFMMMFDKWGMNQFPTLAAMDNFYYSQTDSDGEDDGYIPREVSEADGIDAWAPNGGYRGIGYQDVRSMNPPLWAWAEWEQYMIHGDAARFGKVIRGKTIYERLKAHFAFIERYKKLDNGLYGKTNGYSNGLDNTFNQGAPYNGADPASDGGQTYNDLSLQQAQFAYYIAKIAGAVGNAAEQAYYEGEHARISALIREKMWDETAKMFSNLDRDQVTHTNVSTPTTLWALAAHVATEQQAGDLIKYHGGNSQKMFRPYGLSTAAYDDARYAPPGGYWQGSYWAPTSYQYIKGLGEYGYDTLAFEEALRHLTSVTGVYQATSTMWENYSADYLSRGSSSRSNFVGWTGCLSIGVILEDVLGVRLNAPDNIIDWNIRLTEEHGVSNLWMKHGGAVNRVSLLANERVSAKDPVTFTVTADCGVTLQVKNGAVTKTVDVEAGTHTYSIDGEAGAAPRLSIGRARDNAAFGQAALAASSDYVYFGQAADPSIFDGLTYQVRKGAGLITNVNTVGYSAASATNPPTYRADDALRALGAADAMEAVKVPHANGNEGFMFRVPAKNTPQTVTVLVGVTNAQAEIVARLSDESAPPAVLRLTGGPAESVYAVEIPYRAAADGRHLLVTFTHTAKTGAIALKGIVLSEGARPGVPAGVTVTAQNTAVKIDAEPPAGETFDSWNVYYGLSPDNLDRSASAASMPFVIGGLTNLVKYYVAVAGVKDGAEGIPSAVLRVVPEEYPLSDEERAAVDLDAAIPVIMNGNDAENAKNWLQTVGAGSVYESAVSWSSSTNGQYPGIWDTGEIEFPVGRDMPTRITITSVYGAATVTKTVDVIVKAVDVRRGAYVLDTAVSVYTGGVYLTQEGSKDWIQFTQAVNGSNPQARKAGGRGFGIPRLAFTSPDHKRAGGLGLTYVYEAADAVQTDPAITDGYAVDMRGLGDYIEVDVAYSEKPQRASVYFGVWRSAVRADFVVNGAIVASETASQNGGGVTNFRAAFDFKLQNAGDTASIRLTLADDTNFGSHAGSLVYNALTLQELDAPLHNIPKVPVAVLPAASTASFNNGAVNLTGEGTFDWWQFPQDSETDYARKQSGFGLFGFKRNHDAVPSGERGRVTDTLISYSATDRDTNYPDVISKSGMQCRGAGNGFQFEIAASGSPRVLNVYTGNWNSIATTEYIVDGQTRYSNVTDNLGHGVYRHTIYIAPGETGLVRHTLASMTATGYGGVHGSTFVLAVTLGTDSAAGYGTKVPAERFAHKSAGVDPSIENCGLGGKNVGGIGAGSWLTYGIDVEAAGLYQLALEYAAQSATNPGLTILLDDKPIGSVTQITATGAGQTWAYRTVDVALPAGAHVLKLSYANAGTNLRSLNFKYLSDYVPETGVTLTRSGGALTAVFTIGNAAPSAADAQCVIAMYDGGGRLAKVETIPVSVGAETGTECSAVRLYDGAFAKAFIWDADTRIPLCDAAILP